MVSLLIAVVLMAIVFDYINGFHDAANAIATVVSTGVLPIRTAVFLAGILNFMGAVTGTAVAKTIATGFADPSTVTQAVVLAALIGASTWNIITWWFGIPSSSSHALVGGLAGAVVAHAGLSAFKWGALVQKVLIPLVASPTIGFVVAFFTMVGLVWIARGHWKRPVLVGLCLIPSRLPLGQSAFVLFAGLKGAVPILLGSFLLVAHVPDAERLHGIVVVVVVFSVVVQGSLTPVVARWLRVPMRIIEPQPDVAVVAGVYHVVHGDVDVLHAPSQPSALFDGQIRHHNSISGIVSSRQRDGLLDVDEIIRL